MYLAITAMATIAYNKGDCVSLLSALQAAQTTYIDKYKVDITSIVN